MAIDPSDLDPKHWKKLTEQAKRTGRSVEELIAEALDRYLGSSDWMKAQEPAFAAVWDNDHDSIFDDL